MEETTSIREDIMIGISIPGIQTEADTGSPPFWLVEGEERPKSQGETGAIIKDDVSKPCPRNSLLLLSNRTVESR